MAGSAFQTLTEVRASSAEKAGHLLDYALARRIGHTQVKVVIHGLDFFGVDMGGGVKLRKLLFLVKDINASSSGNVQVTNARHFLQKKLCVECF